MPPEVLKLLAPDAAVLVLLEDPCVRCYAEWQVRPINRATSLTTMPRSFAHCTKCRLADPNPSSVFITELALLTAGLDVQCYRLQIHPH